MLLSHIPERSRRILVGIWLCVVSLTLPYRVRAQGVETLETAGSVWVAANRAAAEGHNEEYRRLMARAVAIAPQHPAPLYGLARADVVTGRYDEALRVLDRLAAMGFARFDVNDSAFGRLAKDPGFSRIAARLADNRRPILTSDTALVIPGADRIPESIAYDPRSDAYFIGSLARRTVTRVSGSGDTAAVAGPEDGLLRVVGMKTDTSRGRLWVATWAPVTDSAEVRRGRQSESRLFAFDLGSGRKLLMLEPDDTLHSHSFNDLVVTSTGDVYVTDTDEGASGACARVRKSWNDSPAPTPRASLARTG